MGSRHQAVFEMRRGDFDDIELPEGPTPVVAEKREGGAETGAEGGAHFRRVGADDGQLAVVDL